MVEVTAADREAAVGMYTFVQSRMKKPHPAMVQTLTVGEIAGGDWDHDEAVQAFARHRIAALREAAADPTVVARLARAICCPSGICGKGDSPFSICQTHTFIRDAQAALAALVGQRDAAGT